MSDKREPGGFADLPAEDQAAWWALEKRKAEAVYLQTIRFCDDRIWAIFGRPRP